MATVKFKDTTLTLLGNEVKVGQAAPDFKVQKSADMSDYTLASGAGKTRITAARRPEPHRRRRRDRLHLR